MPSCLKIFATTLVSILILSVSCDRGKEETLTLPEGFAFRNISGTAMDRSKTIFQQLDSAGKMNFVVPVVFGKLRGNEELDYFIHWQSALLTSKQEKIGDYTPIIVNVTGDDFEAEYMILLNDKNKPVSALMVGGSGFCGGPEEVNDSLLRFCPTRNSIFKDGEIFTNVATITFRPDSVPHRSMIDSVNYKSRISEDGKFITERIDSVRYEGPEF